VGSLFLPTPFKPSMRRLSPSATAAHEALVQAPCTPYAFVKLAGEATRGGSKPLAAAREAVARADELAVRFSHQLERLRRAADGLAQLTPLDQARVPRNGRRVR